MTTMTSVTRVGDLPRVNLLPPEIQERKKVRAAQAGAVGATLVAVAGVVFAYVQAGHSVDAARQQLAREQQTQATLDKQVAALRDVKTVAAQLSADEALLTRAMATEISWSTYLQDFSATLPATTWLTQLNLSESVPAGTLATPAQASSPVGSVSFTGVAMKWPNLADFLDALAKEQGFANAYFSNATESYIGQTKIVNFQATTDLTQGALSGRCANPGSC